MLQLLRPTPGHRAGERRAAGRRRPGTVRGAPGAAPAPGAPECPASDGDRGRRAGDPVPPPYRRRGGSGARCRGAVPSEGPGARRIFATRRRVRNFRPDRGVASQFAAASGSWSGPGRVPAGGALPAPGAPEGPASGGDPGRGAGDRAATPHRRRGGSGARCRGAVPREGAGARRIFATRPRLRNFPRGREVAARSAAALPDRSPEPRGSGAGGRGRAGGPAGGGFGAGHRAIPLSCLAGARAVPAGGVRRRS